METPEPAIRIPVWPVARKSAFVPRRSRVHLADRTVGAHGQQALARARLAAGHLELLGRVAHVEELAAMLLGGGLEHRHVGQLLVQTAGEVHAELQRAVQHVDPLGRDAAAAIGDADDHRLHPGLGGLLHGHVGQAEVGLAARQAELAETPFRAPLRHALSRLGGQLIGRIAQEEKIGMGDFHREDSLLSNSQPRSSGYEPQDTYSGVRTPRYAPRDMHGASALCWTRSGVVGSAAC